MTFSSNKNLYEDFNTPNKTVFDNQAIQNAIKNILLTHIGTMPGKPEFGSRVMEIPFNLNDTITHMLLKQVVEEALAKWEKRVTFQDVKVVSNDVNTLTAKIYYKYNDTGISGSIVVDLVR